LEHKVQELERRNTRLERQLLDLNGELEKASRTAESYRVHYQQLKGKAPGASLPSSAPPMSMPMHLGTAPQLPPGNEVAFSYKIGRIQFDFKKKLVQVMRMASFRAGQVSGPPGSDQSSPMTPRRTGLYPPSQPHLGGAMRSLLPPSLPKPSMGASGMRGARSSSPPPPTMK
jgi:hypothetical protein